MRNGGMERNEEIDEWAASAVHALLVRCFTRAAEVLAWLADLESWE